MVCFLDLQRNVCILHLNDDGKYDGTIKLFEDDFSKWEKVQEFIEVRKNSAKSTKYCTILNRLSRSFKLNEGYHSLCYKNFTAVKKIDSQLSMVSPKVTKRSDVTSPKNTSRPHVLPEVCIFCDSKRKMFNRKWEKLSSCEQFRSESTILNAASEMRDENILLKIGGTDMISKEAKYHQGCKVNYLNKYKKFIESNNKEDNDSSHIFDAVENYIRKHILEQGEPRYLHTIFDIYKSDFAKAGGDSQKLSSYTLQKFGEKIKRKFKNKVSIQASGNRNKVIWKTGSMPLDQVYVCIESQSSSDTTLIKKCASILRDDILAMKCNELHEPLTVEDVLKGEVDIPDSLQTFFQNLYAGENETLSNKKERLANSSAADAVFACSNGKLIPGKHLALGCAVKSKTGSKGLIDILNRFGHTISNETIRKVDMMLESTVEMKEELTPAIIEKEPNLCTGTAWDNFDINVETMSGADTIHHTYGICYQNIGTQAAAPVSKELEGKVMTGRKRKINMISQSLLNADEVQPYWKKPKMSQFPQLKTIIFSPESFHVYQDLDTLWMIAFNNSYNTPMWTGFNTQHTYETNHQEVGYMKHIKLPPTRYDVVRETLVRSQAVAKECGQSQALVTYDLAIAKIAKKIQCESSPEFDNVFVMFGSFHIELNILDIFGRLIEGSGGPFVLSEGKIIAPGSTVRFLRGKPYNRCRRAHILLSSAFQGLHFESFVEKFNISKDIIDKILMWANTEQRKIELDKDVKYTLAQYEIYVFGYFGWRARQNWKILNDICLSCWFVQDITSSSED